MCIIFFFKKKGCIIEWIKKKNFNQINKLINLFLNIEKKKKKTNTRTNLLVSVSSHQKLLHSIKK